MSKRKAATAAQKQQPLFSEVEIKVRTGFARSTNLKHDFNDPKSLEHLVVSEKVQRQFGLFIPDVLDASSRARVRVWSGTPGVGKSTFALMTSRLLAKKNSKQLTERILEQKSVLSTDFKTNLEQMSQLKKFMVVFLNGDEGQVEEAFVQALGSAFQENGLKEEFDALVREDSQKSVKVIKLWEKSYPKKLDEFKNALGVKDEEAFGTFMNSLRRGTREAQKSFLKAYEAVTGGANFDQFAHVQVVELYERATAKLKELKFGGIVVFYDEFGKYLERGVRHPTDFDLQFLQDFAEACNASGKNQLHLILLTHLPISQYATNLPASIQQEWSKIEGRFSQVSFNDSSASQYSLLHSAFETDLKSQSTGIYGQASELAKGWLKAVGKTKALKTFVGFNQAEAVCVKAFPLQPAVTALLPLVSEKVAQSERTLFSFLSRDEEHSLQWFIKNHPIIEDDYTLLTPYWLYKYFQPLIAADTGVGGSYRLYLIADRVLGALDAEEEAEKEIVALLALAGVINNRSVLKTDLQTLQALLFGYLSSETVKKALEGLAERKLVMFDRINNEYLLFEGSSVDIRDEIRKRRASALTSDGYVKILRQNFDLSYVVPKRYNFSKGMTRYLSEHLISLNELEKMKSNSVDFLSEDGKVCYLGLFSRDEINTAREILAGLKLSCVLFVLPNQPLEIEAELLELHAIEQIYSVKEILNAGAAVQKELDHHRDIAKQVIRRSCYGLKSTSHMNCSIYYSGAARTEKIVRLSDVSEIASQIMEEEFNKTPLLNNEMINKHRVSTPIIQARLRLLEAMDVAHKPNWGIENSGPELSILKCLLAANKFQIESEQGKAKFVGLKKTSQLYPLFEDFLEVLRASQTTPVDIDFFIRRWAAPPFGVREQLLQLYFALFMRIAPSPVSVYLEGNFVAVHDSQMFESFMKQPRKYSLQMIEVTKEIRDYLQSVVKGFASYVPSGKGTASVDNFVDAAKVVSAFYNIVPEFSRRHQQLSVEQRKLVASLDSFKQPETYFLKTLPEIYFGRPFADLTRDELATVHPKIQKDADALVGHYAELLKAVGKNLRLGLERLLKVVGLGDVVVAEKGAPLAKLWKEAFDRLPADMQKFPFAGSTAKFVNRVKQLDATSNNQWVVETLADALTGSSPRVWNEKGKLLFDFNLQQALSQIVQISLFLQDEKAHLTTITTVGDNGLPVAVEFVQGQVDDQALESLNDKVKKAIDGLTVAEANRVLISLLLEMNKNGTDAVNVTNKTTIGEAWG